MDSDYFCYAEAKIAELQHQLAAAEARVKELDIETEQMTQVIDSWHESYTRLWADNARLREGLEFYGDRENYKQQPSFGVCQVECVPVLFDHGNIARNALNKLDKER